MRSLAILLLLVPTVASAEPSLKREADEAEPTWELELQLGYGIARRGTAHMAETEPGPLSFAALGAVAINEEPHAFAYGGLVGEAKERSGVGVTAGARLEMRELPVRLSGGGVWMFAPETLWGAQAAAGSCFGRSLAICGDVALTAYFAGTGLPADETEVQVQFVLGFAVRGGD
ncbi:MAG: hypothetical protein HOV81_05175 [Kofleriaceae bacterium]|nr:hypothetical protein [Kofleriaceae bacterium]